MELLLFSLFWLLSTTTLQIVEGQGRTAAQRRPKNFEDYLISVSQPREQNEVNKPQNPVTSSTPSPPSRSESEPDILGYFRDVPRQHWSCCMLGKLAGDKGFHCTASFYAARIARRNHNRAHTRRMLFHGPNPIVNWGRDLMTTFSYCIAEYSQQFHDCCYTATIERGERRKWRMYRRIEQQIPDES